MENKNFTENIYIGKRRNRENFFKTSKTFNKTNSEIKIEYLLENLDTLIKNINNIYNIYIKTVSLNFTDHITEIDYILETDKTTTFLVIKKINSYTVIEMTLCDWLVDNEGYIVELDKPTLKELLTRYKKLTDWYYYNYNNNENSYCVTNSKKIKPYIIQVEAIVDIFYNISS